jgi:NodT family efflux transporter outer membrane factor (OMF) lipoprotein
VKYYEQALQLTMNRFIGGAAPRSDVAQAQTQLETTRVQATDVGVARAQFEHAIATLMGKPPAEFNLPPRPLEHRPPEIPVGVPSQLLERRPDIAAAERRVAEANEQIGIAKAAYFPTLNLNGTVGTTGKEFADLFSLPNRFWTVGGALAETLFDGGRRRGNLRLAEATYDQFAATYRQTVLTAFQQVEDNLSTLRYLQEEAGQVKSNIEAAQRQEDIAVAQYKAGTGSYLQVITAQVQTLNAKLTAVILQGRRLVANVTLVQALGGGWSTSLLPTRHDVVSWK